MTLSAGDLKSPVIEIKKSPPLAKILYCVVTRLEVDKLKEIVLDMDEHSFITIYPVNDIVGGRFKKSGH